MNRKILSVVTLFLMLLNVSGLALADVRPKAAPSNLVSLLPDSDAVAIVDARRCFDEALPRLLSAKPALLTKINTALADFQHKTGVDVRKFDQLAVGLNFRSVGVKSYDSDIVLIGRGTLNMSTVIAAAKESTKGTFREEKLGTHTITIFTIKKPAGTQPTSNGTGISGAVDNTLDRLETEFAVGTLDANTLVAGTPARVRETFEAKSTVAPEITSLLSPRAIVSFAARSPEGLASFLPMDNDELGKHLAAIRYLSGSVDLVANNANLAVMARSTDAEHAKGLFDTAEFLQKFGKGLLGSSKRPENAVYARMIDNAKIAQNGNDVTLDLTVAKSDIDILLATLVK